jgi:hypothetical protein
MVFAAAPVILTVFGLDGRPLLQNPASQAYFGDRLRAHAQLAAMPAVVAAGGGGGGEGGDGGDGGGGAAADEDLLSQVRGVGLTPGPGRR